MKITFNPIIPNNQEANKKSQNHRNIHFGAITFKPEAKDFFEGMCTSEKQKASITSKLQDLAHEDPLNIDVESTKHSRRKGRIISKGSINFETSDEKEYIYPHTANTKHKTDPLEMLNDIIANFKAFLNGKHREEEDILKSDLAKEAESKKRKADEELEKKAKALKVIASSPKEIERIHKRLIQGKCAASRHAPEYRAKLEEQKARLERALDEAKKICGEG